MSRTCPVCDRRYQADGPDRCPRDGARLLLLEGTLPPGTVVDDRYTVVRLIGRGGMGAVYQAHDAVRREDVALKLLLNTHMVPRASARRFLGEARLLTELRHPNIVSVLDFGEQANGELFIAMELLQGRSLSERILQEGPLPVAEAVDVATQVCDALGHAHASGVVHRDLKPENLFLVPAEPQGHLVKVLDFGVARARADMTLQAEEQAGVVVGTPGYTSAEQARGADVDHRSDVYSLGAVLYEALTGARVFSGEHHVEVLMKQVYEAPTPIREAHPHVSVPAGLDGLVLSALAKDPAARPQSMEEFRQRLEESLCPPSDGSGVVAVADVAPARATGLGVGSADTLDLTEDEPAEGLPGGGLSFAFPIVGRKKERRALLSYARESADEGAARCVALEGEAGVGKRKLLDWLAHAGGLRSGLRTLRGGYGIRAEQSMQGLRSVLLSVLSGLGEGAYDSEDVAVVDAFVDPSPGQQGLERRDDPAQEDRFFGAVTRVLLREAKRTPLLIVLEEVHRAGVGTFRLLEYLVAAASREGGRILLSFTFDRTACEPSHPLWETLRWLSEHEGRAFRRMSVSRLDEEERRAFCARIGLLAPDLGEYLGYIGAGNPLHTLQLARYLLDEGLIEDGPEGWDMLGGVAAHTGIPPALADLVDARVAAVMANSRDEALPRVLRRAGLLGQRFPVALLEAELREEGLVEDAEALEAHIDFLAEHGLIQEYDDGEIGFEHGLIREVIVREAQDAADAVAIHASIARAMLGHYASVPGPYQRKVADHFRQAGERSHAAYSYAAAGHAALDASDHVSAGECFRLGLRCVRGQEAGGPLVRLDLWSGLAEVQIRLGEPPLARESLETVYDLAASVGDASRQARAKARLAGLAMVDGRNEEAAVLLDEAEGPALRSDDGVLVGEIWVSRGDLDERRGAYGAALEAYQKAQRVFCEQSAGGRLSVALSAAAIVLCRQGEFDQALEEARRAVEVGENAALPDEQARNWNRLGLVHHYRSEHREALSCFQRSLRIVEGTGYRLGVAHALQNVGACYGRLGDVVQAREAMGEAYAALDEVGAAWGVAVALSNLAFLDVQDGRYRRALRLASRGLDMCARLGDSRGAAVALENAGHGALGLGDLDRAEEYFQRSLELAAEIGAVWSGNGECYEGLGEIWLKRGNIAEAERCFKAATDLYRQLDDSDGLDRVRKRRSEFGADRAPRNA